MSDYHANALSEAMRRLGKYPASRIVVERAVAVATAVSIEFQQAVIAEVPEFSKSRNPDLLPEMAAHCTDIIDEIVRLLVGGGPARLGLVEEHARRRAAQHFPLEATLHAYRSSHKVLLRWLRKSVLAAALSAQEAEPVTVAIVEFSMEFVDAISTLFAGSYAAHASLLAEAAVDQRSELLQVLLDGRDESEVAASRVLREAGFLQERQFFCVALARSVDPTEMLDLSRARRMANAIDKTAEVLGVRRIVSVHNNRVVMIAATLSRDSGWTAPRTSLAKRIRSQLNLVGNAALIGVSDDVPSTSRIPKAYREAETALGQATVSERVVQFCEIPLRRLLIHFAAEDFHRVLPAWVAAFYSADDRSDGTLVATLRIYARFDMNILKAAKELGVHPNTIYARLQRVFNVSGLDPRSFNALSDLLIVCDCAQSAAGS